MNGTASSSAPQHVHLTDRGNAQRLVAQHGNDLRYCWPWKKWLAWDGNRWKVDDSGRVYRAAKDTIAALYQDALGLDDPGQRKATLKHAMGSEQASRIEAMISLARSESEIPILPDDLDADPWLLNIKNGTIDLRTGEIREHRREDRLTKLSPTAYHPDATAPTWEAFLTTTFDGNAGLIEFVKRLLGYCLTGRTTEHVLPIFHGSGANGKSTLLNAVMDVLGSDYAAPGAGELLLAKSGSDHPTAIADLHGLRLVALIETDEGKRLAEGLVKQLTGGDKLKARRMREDFWAFDATHKAILACNHKPEVRGTDHAIWRRIRLVPFEVTIPPDEQDKALGDKLRSEAEGILAWLVAGCLEWQAEGLGEPPEVAAATDSYRSEQDTLSAFLGGCCVVATGCTAPASALYEAYQEFGGELSQTRFGKALTERGFQRGRFSFGPHRGRISWSGVGLRGEEL